MTFIQFFNQYTVIITLIWTGASLAVGAWAGHSFSLWRDRRKDFNAVSDPIELFLMKERERFKSEDVRSSKIPINFNDLSLHLPDREQGAYQQAKEKYFTAMAPYESRGMLDGTPVTTRSIPDVLSAIDGLLVFAKHRL
ncbi:hypothetical protein CEQ20_08540 [Yersinia pseudotuberculosis]|uniref:hypothetical protein n=1 Tax=Yersinia pseudotuberculosis TaxID=633 RepID=UPI00061BD07D|nr:hypothetical protein [Yersinia pseudotuberculosis]AXY33458.1 hypothetical protein CEQ20_08540 [Yersinia pseudotuberculosis]PEI13034.1 hypothetical protein CRM78_07070 [Yersinia pseudotuberculosis]CNI64255.1 Uncharacterised protein [Yersinia pseudotuberculosis]CNJ06403.1 Uncharacterised protein [Yersinia pseudotuberculosis]